MRDFLPAIYDASGVGYRTGSAEESFNIMPIMLHGKTIGAHPRNEMVNANDFTPSSSADRGRVFSRSAMTLICIWIKIPIIMMVGVRI